MASFQVMMIEISYSIFEMEISAIDVERMKIWIDIVWYFEDDGYVISFNGNRIRWDEDHGYQGMARNVADRGGERARPYEERDEREMESMIHLE